MAKDTVPEKVKEPTQAERIEALEKAVHGLQIKHGLQDKRLDALEDVNELRLRSRGLID